MTVEVTTMLLLVAVNVNVLEVVAVVITDTVSVRD